MSSILADLTRLEEGVREIQEDHGAERASVDLQRYRGNPVGFAKEVLKFDAYDRQADLLNAPLSHKYSVARGCHAAGKDATLAALLLYMAYVEGKLCLAISATEKRLLGQLWVEVRRRFAASNLPGVLLTSSLEIGGVKRIVAMTSGSVSNLTGWHDPNGVFVAITEGQGDSVEAAAYDSAIANVTDDRSAIVAGGNPIRATGRFYEIHQHAHWHKIHFSALDYPNVREGREVIPGGPSASWVEEVAREYGIESAYYKARVLGEFPTEGSIDQLITRQYIDQAFELWATPAFRMRSNGHRHYLVADIARGGPDLNCVARVRGPTVEELTTFSEPDLMQTAKKLHQRALELGFFSLAIPRPTEEALFEARCTIKLDDAGVGGGVTDRLKELKARVRPFNGAESPPPARPPRFANRRASAYFDLRDKLLRGWIALPPDEKLAEELLATNYTLNGANLILMEEKKLIRARLKRSPDRADTVSMAAEKPTGSATTHVVYT